MKQAFKDFQNALLSKGTKKDVRDKEWDTIVNTTVIAMAAGGEGSRFQSVAAQKNSYQLPNGQSLIERNIRLYKEAGFTNFVALVYHEADSIHEVLGDGSQLGVTVTYSYDPKKGVGRGGAVKHALEQGAIPSDATLILHNDDQVVNYPGSFPRDIMAGHLAGVEQGALATMIMVEGSEYVYSAMQVDNGFVSAIEYHPMVPIPTHMGTVVFSPECFAYFDRMISYDQKTEPETVVIPKLAQEKKLYSFVIPSETWMPVNDPKDLKKLLAHMHEHDEI